MQLNFPTYNFRLSREGERVFIYDIIRRKNVVLSPEEWVRQHLVWYLIHEKKVPQSLIAVERKLVINHLERRFDVLVFDRQGKPYLLCECKAPDVALNETTSLQIAQYNSVLMAPFLLISNGLLHYYYILNEELRVYESVEALPLFG